MSRNKGNVAEREVAKLIEGWWRQADPEASFVRTPLSGGWGGPKIRSGFQASGDLMTTSASFPFTTEVKRREAWSLDRLLQGKKSPVWGWWRQAIKQGDEMTAEPMLWLRRNREPWRVLVPWNLMANLLLAGLHEESVTEWAPWQLNVHDLAREPVMIYAHDLLKTDPRIFAKMRQRGKTGGQGGADE